MNKTIRTILAVTVATAATAAVASEATARTAHAAAVPTVKLANSSDGKILVAGNGFTVYAFTGDRHGKDSCTAIAGCASVWPPLTTRSKPVPGPGSKASLLGTITLRGSVKQVTYAGHPLYTYSGDGSPASTDYVGASGFGGGWDAITATGHLIN